MSVEITLMILSGLVIFSYLFDLIAKQFKIPSVILLLLSGIGLRYLATWVNIPIPNFEPILPLVGTIGLILIVLEGALELKLEREKSALIKSSLASAFFILILTTTGIAFFYYYLLDADFKTCFLNAVPLGVISSAIAIPSAASLPVARKDFIVYESSLSDIFGIILFNFMLANETIGFNSFLRLGWQTILILILSAAFCLILLYLLKRITHHLKFFLIIAVLILVYAIGKYYHLPTLVIVLAFGLFLNNLHWIRNAWFKRTFKYDNFYKDLHQLVQLSGESAFIVRTFFFLIFGFTLNVQSLLNADVLIYGSIVVVIIYAIRIVYQKIFVRTASLAEFFLSPRGLISILLFFSIPDAQKLKGVENGLLFFVILATSIVMTFGLVSTKEKKQTIPDLKSEINSDSLQQHS
ncbi:MAG: cation:proton antiporter [Cyclobacteriaceae bacterium]|nr:cation:proton antiporter [Cyclobacteriaceae bacterium]